MIRLFWSVCWCLSALLAQSQVLDRCQDVVGATGGYAQRNGLSWSWTVGEAIISTLSSTTGGLTVTQGFHQPDVCLPVSVTDVPGWDGWEVQAYPNPVADHITIQYVAPGAPELYLSVSSLSGQLFRQQITIGDGIFRLPCADWPAGQYIIQLSQNTPKVAPLAIPFIKL